MTAFALTLGLTATGIAIALAGLAALTGRMNPRIPSAGATLAGLALATLPWLRSPPPPPEPDVTLTTAPLVLSPDGRRTMIGTAPQSPPPPLPGREAAAISIEAAEVEPNDTLPAANRARAGVAIDGTLAPGDRDWFAVDIGPDRHGRLTASLLTTDASVTMTLLDDAGQPLGIARTIDEVNVRTATLERAVTGPRYFILLVPASGATARYQLIVANRRW